MNDDTFQKMWWGIVKWTLIPLVSISILGTLFWALFYSVPLANLPFIIPLRDSYQNTYWKVEGLFLKPRSYYPPFDPIYSIEPQISPIVGTNIYLLRGKFLSVDLNSNLIFLTAFNRKIYSFKVSKNFAYEYASSPGFTQIDYSPEKDIIKLDNTPFTRNSFIVITWDDKRSLYQIQKDYSQNPQISLNNNSDSYFSLFKAN